MIDRAKPQTISSTLFQELELLFEDDAPPNAFKLAAIKRSAEALAKINAADASLVRAGVAALEWDFEKAAYQIRNALTLDRSTVVLLNSALTFSALNEVEKAADLTLQAVKLSPNDQQAVTQAIECLMSAGRITEAQSLVQNHIKMGLPLQEDEIELDGLCEYLQQSGMEEIRIRAELEAAYSILNSRQLRCRAIAWKIASDPDGGQGLVFELGFKGNIGLELELEAELAEALSSKETWDPNVLNVEFHYIKPNVLQAV